jgi:hypothetical protein
VLVVGLVATLEMIAQAGAIQDGGLNADARPIWQTNGTVYALAVTGGVLYAGGDFTRVRPPGQPLGSGEVAREHFAALDAATGTLLSLHHVLDGGIRALRLSPDQDTLYVGGQFTHVDGLTRGHVAAFNTATGALEAGFHPSVNGPVRAIATSPEGSTVYLGGVFERVNGVATLGGHSVSNLAAVSSTGQLRASFAPRADKVVHALAVPNDGSRVIVGGAFNYLDGVSGRGIGAVDPIDGSIEPWQFHPIPLEAAVKTIITDGQGHAFIGSEGTYDGTFAVNYSNGSEFWFDRCYGATQALVLLKGWLFVASHMHNCAPGVVGGPKQVEHVWHHFEVEDPSNGHVGGWWPNTGGNPLGPRALATDGAQLFAGGDFLAVNHKKQQGLTRFGGPPDTTAPSRPPTPTAAGAGTGAINVTLTASLDIDDGTLTYTVLRDGSVTVATRTITSKPWLRPTVTVTDSGLASGSTHRYTIRASDGVNSNQSSQSAPVVAP